MRMRIPHSSLSRRDRCVCVEMYERLGRKPQNGTIKDQMSVSIPFSVSQSSPKDKRKNTTDMSENRYRE